MSRESASKRERAVVAAASTVAGLAAVLATTVVGAGSAQAAPARPSTDCSSAYLGPQGAGTTSPNYFNLTAAPGQRLTENLIAANPTASRCTVILSRAFGRTALNSGDTYVNVGHGCAGAACWLSGVPATVTVPPHARITVPFTVSTPADAKSGQYLAGVVGEPTVASPASRSKRGVVVAVRSRVAIGVAITVPGGLHPAVSIPSVQVEAHQAVTSAGVAITEVNDGNTWEHPAGKMTVQVGDRKVDVPVTSDTVLGNGVATLRVSANRISGRHLTRVALWYAHHTKLAVWQGMLTFPKPPDVSRHGNQLVIKQGSASDSVPWWAWAAIGLATLLVVLVGFLLLMLRKRRRDDDADERRDEDEDKDKDKERSAPPGEAVPAPTG